MVSSHAIGPNRPTVARAMSKRTIPVKTPFLLRSPAEIASLCTFSYKLKIYTNLYVNTLYVLLSFIQTHKIRRITYKWVYHSTRKAGVYLHTSKGIYFSRLTSR